MVSLLLALIYLAFISLGLPDSLLGSAWPAIYTDLNVPLSYAGIVSMLIAGGTIVSSLASDRITRRFGAGLVTAVSVLMTALALFGFSTSNHFYLLCIWAIPYGLGAGAVDAALNNYVALHYASRHMSWLHCFWGVGATISPYIMSYALTNHSWTDGYRIVSFIQIALTAILFLSLPLWTKNNIPDAKGKHSKALTLVETFKIPGVPYVLLCFFAYCAMETTTGLWASTYLVRQRGISPEIAASFASLFFIGITVGRFLNGFISERFGDKTLIRAGIVIILIGITLLGIPLPIEEINLLGLIVIGLGCAPIYPCIIHSTPENFGKDKSAAIIGIQMASAYTGSTLMPPLFGVIAQFIHVGLFPLFLLFFALLMLSMSERLNRIILKNKAST